ncbi:MAG: T9SS type A sorting domain-containing protein [Bacteroidia bacterium]|nr:T9SS type A sorting domain-containing protein [Bacteroidia bacterium]
MFKNFKSAMQIIVLSLLVVSCARIKNSIETEGSFPGYYDQWLFMRTNGSGVLPEMSKYHWDVVSSKRENSDALMNVKEVGPDNIGGRIRGMVVDYSNPNHIIVGGASGGVFVSENNGASWRPINDQALSPSVTYMDQNPFLPKVIYYTTGEYSGNSADLMGSGVFKSTDGGNTFEQLSFTNRSEFQFTWSVKCSPKDTNVLYVATNSSGLWRSDDAGDTFVRVYNTGSQMNDLEVFPDGSVMFTIKGSGVYRSNTGNINTFSKVTSISSTSTARGELAYCKNAPNVVYAAISGPDDSYNGVLSAFYKSSDGGKTFVKKSNPNSTVGFGFTWYTLTMLVNPNDSNDVFIASVSSGYTYNGGTSWFAANDQHSDHHIAVSSGNNCYVGSDGGLCYYNWSNFNNYTSLNNGLNITQFYHGDVSPNQQYFFGGCQDNGTKESRNGSKIFSNIFGGDGGHSFYHPTKNNYRYYATQNGAVYRNGSNIANNIPTTDAKWFIHPYTISPTVGEYVLYPSNTYLYFSSNEGSNFKSLGKISTGRLYCAAFSPDVNPSAFSGGSNALVAVDSVLNTVPKYKDLRLLMPSYIRASFVSSIKVIPGTRDEIYISFSNIADSGRVWKVTDVFGTPVFKNISRNLPKGLPVNWVECDPFNPSDVIFAGTDYGLYITEDGGETWVKDTRLPSTVISNIKIDNNKKDIYFFTHGRGVFKGQINNQGISNIKSNTVELLKSAYPIPANNVLNIEIKNTVACDFKIVDLNGKQVLNGKLKESINVIDVSKLNNGNYILIYSEGLNQGSLRFNVVH